MRNTIRTWKTECQITDSQARGAALFSVAAYLGTDSKSIAFLTLLGLGVASINAKPVQDILTAADNASQSVAGIFAGGFLACKAAKVASNVVTSVASSIASKCH